MIGSNGKGGGHVEAAGFSFTGIENFNNVIMKYNPSQILSKTEIKNNKRQLYIPPNLKESNFKDSNFKDSNFKESNLYNLEGPREKNCNHINPFFYKQPSIKTLC